MSKSKTPIYRIKVTLRNVAPPVWRRIDDRIEARAAGHDCMDAGGRATHGAVAEGRPVCGFEVPADIKLDKLHHILQAVMGWADSHMHAFRMGMVQYGTPSREFPGMFKNERTARLDQLAGEGKKLIYEYDFADGPRRGQQARDGLLAVSAMVGSTSSR